ncbi:MAG: hypothetical protein K9N10_03710 [Deltaproteobacteria bacterium]|nr:hypothetical protein [Deltaproteobacteria bacterium]
MRLCIVGILLLGTFFILGCAEDTDDEETILGSPSLDPNYLDYGMVNIKGNTGTTKACRFSVSKWDSDANYARYAGGVNVDEFMFYFSTKSPSVLKVQDMNSGVSKDLAKKRDEYVKLINAQTLEGKNIWTVIRGFVNDGSGEAARYVARYRLLVRSYSGTIKYFDINVEEAFEKGKDLAVSSVGSVQFTNPNSVISLIRVPSLEPNPDSENFGCNDFAIVVQRGSGDRDLFNRSMQFDPQLVDPRQPAKEWMYQPICDNFYYRDKKYIGDISNISATSRIDRNGNYCILIAATCWAHQEIQEDILKYRYYSFVGSNAVEYYVTYADGRYGLRHRQDYKNIIWLKDWGRKEYPKTFDMSHYTFLATFAREIAGYNLAEQRGAFIGFGVKQVDKKDVPALKVRKDLARQAVFDWSEGILTEYGIDPKVELSEAQYRAGEGHIVQGMVLSVPPNAGYEDKFEPVGQAVDPYASVTFTNTITSEITSGTTQTTGGQVNTQLGGICGFPFFALGASTSWSYTQGTQKSTSLKYHSDWSLRDFRGSLIISLEPQITLKSAVLQGAGQTDYRPRSNVKYVNQAETEKAYAVTTAVLGRKPVFDYHYGITDQPGYSLIKPEQEPLRPLVLTQGMLPYRVDQTETGSNYMRLINSLRYFSSEKSNFVLPVLAEGNTWVGSDAGSASNVLLREKMKEITRTVQSWSGSMTVGKFGIISVTASVHGEFSVSLENTYENSTGWVVRYIKALTSKGNFKVIPDVYWVPVSRLKARYGTREPKYEPGQNGAKIPENVSLKFIPDYMWNNNMDYWLLAYTDMKVQED